MELSSSETYEHMLSEDRDIEDRWWFLKGVDPEVAPHGGDRDRGHASELQRLPAVTVIGTSTPCVEASSEPTSGCLGVTELAMLDSFCAKYGGAPQFRADLVKLLLFLLSVQEVTVVNAQNPSVEVTDGFGFVHYKLAVFLTFVITFAVAKLVGRVYRFWLQQSVHAVGATGLERVRNEDSNDFFTDVNQVREGEPLRQGLQGLNSLDVPCEEAFDAIEDHKAWEEESRGAYSDWYESMTDEIEHNLDCWSPK